MFLHLLLDPIDWHKLAPRMSDGVDLNLNLQFSKLKYSQVQNSTFPSYGGVQRVIVEPIVIASVMDHYMRERLVDENKLLIGALLGSRSNYGARVEVKNCFPVKLTRSVKKNTVVCLLPHF